MDLPSEKDAALNSNKSRNVSKYQQLQFAKKYPAKNEGLKV
jgi:hypothetical protein